ncbi:hypothetical protein BV25DRAFT_1816167 [Artomyces pyxidatus]|uniref:Uncharacterized protein n=1 Tax=Artomyces pyxidatus TaxID=48021 RepID=A0ACB8SH72_9AGAM|nr:hypothetical protein BV25DRAFT_1816167 [Artomyces pyxidatus]
MAVGGDTAALREDNSLRTTFLRCEGLSGKGMGLDFSRMVNYIQLVMRCQSELKKDRSATLTSLYDTLDLDIRKRTTVRTFLDWHSKGSKYAAVASGGSIYALVLIAGLDMRVRLGEVDGKAPWIIGNTLRDPPEDSLEGRLVRRQIIPLIALLRTRLPISMPGIFPESLLKEHDLEATVECADIASTDRLFSIIQFNDFALTARNQEIWSSCQAQVNGVQATCLQRATRHLLAGALEVLDAGSSGDGDGEQGGGSRSISRIGEPVELQPVKTRLATRFDLAAEGNQQKRVPEDRSACYAWTERERGYALDAPRVGSVEELRLKLRNYYRGGIRSDPFTYMSIPPEVVDATEDHALRLDCADGSLLAFISTAMPQHLKDRLTDSLLACFAGRQSLVPTNSTSSGESFRFQALHFSWYNRHCTQANNAPTDISPLELENINASRTNHSQLVPYVSKEMRDEEELYQLVKALFREVFEWINTMVATCLPEEHRVLKIEADVLPGNNQSPVYPFLGFVINLNVATKAHLDAQDKLLCLVMALGEYEGGELVMVEPGLVLPLRCGDLVAFQSCRITHFNLHFEGLRSSFVFHTDKAFRSWTEYGHRNGWNRNTTLN